MWGLQPSFLSKLEEGFEDFLAAVGEDELKKEYLLPAVIDDLLKSGRAFVDVLKTSETWFGVTYQEDKYAVKEAFRRLTEKGVYPAEF